MSKVVLGQSGSTPVSLDVTRLVETRLLVNANSGGGKSWLLRRILEQTHGKLQHLVIDPEGEFHTLREKFDYVLVARQGGDCLADPRSAGLLAKRLLELGVSAILDIYELHADERKRFVRLFLESLINAPRDLWHPALVVIDEAHVYAPETGDAESAGPVKDLMTRGRKRGFCGLLATQRLSKLHKDASAEANNVLIGRAAQDVDMKRAAYLLGFTGRDEQAQLRTLDAGHFFAFGPAISATGVIEIEVGPVVTTHPRAGQRAATPAPPRDTVQRVLAQLADLPKEAADEAKTMAELRDQVRRLEREAKAKPAPVVAAPAKIERVEVPILKDSHITSLEKVAGQVATIGEKSASQFTAAVDKFAGGAGEIVAELKRLRNGHHPPATAHSPKPTAHFPPAKEAHKQAPPSGPVGNLGSGESKILVAVAQYPNGATREQLTILTGYKRSTRDAYIQRLQQRGLVEPGGGNVLVTESGIATLGPNFEPLPTGEALREYWLGRLPEGERKILEAVIETYPNAADRDGLSELTGYKRSTRDAYIQRLGTRKLVKVSGRGEVQATEDLF